jgi:hypothetical protein
MGFEIDIFISYAHIDNLPLREGERGWVAEFHRVLEVRLAQLLGEKPQIWRDQKLQGNDYFSDEIVQQFPKTAVMISVLSPRYIKSEWCTKEVKKFCKAASECMGIRFGNKSRIFKVIKTAVPYSEHPPEIADTLGYEFFVPDPHTGRLRELDQKAGGELEQIYWARLDDMAHDICELLVKLKHSGETGVLQREEEEQLTVYLAETDYDLKKQRDMIKRELTEFGYEVLPDLRLPAAASEFSKTVEGLLDQSVLSIHLVGTNYGPVPEGTGKSIITLQNELAAQKSSKNGKLQRLIWLLPHSDTQTTDERQKQFIHLVRTDINTQYGADMFETPIEDFKHAIHDKLKALKPPATFIKTGEEKKPVQGIKETPITDLEEGPRLIYVICDRRDLDHITPLEDYLYKSEFDVILPAFEGEEADLIRDHRENLKTCDAVLIYYGLGNELWMRAVFRELTKIAGYGRTKPLDLKGVFLASPGTRQKERFRSHGSLIINGIEGFSPELMDPFVTILKAIETG